MIGNLVHPDLPFLASSRTPDAQSLFTTDDGATSPNETNKLPLRRSLRRIECHSDQTYPAGW